jgi:DNA-directed RNA polymerase subunit K/omega
MMPSLEQETPAATADVEDPGGQASDRDAVPGEPPLTSRFMLINVAALRAKQLRRGAAPRVELIDRPKTAEQFAMEEVKCGLIQYDPRGGRADSDDAGEAVVGTPA